MDGYDDILSRILAGETLAIARLMSRAEGRPDDVADIMADVHKNAGRAHVIGLTGVPGSGKSTLVHAMAKRSRADGRTVGIIAVDPSSPYSGGAILGDRVRMSDLATDEGVFIRSLATRGALGGLARAAMDTVDILDAAGFDVVLIETVGVGQDEVDIAGAAETVLVVSAPGLGDGIQAIKAGVLEIADIHVVSKCDKDESSRTVADLKSMLHLGSTARNHHGWEVPVLRTSAETNLGIDELNDALNNHRIHLVESGERVIRRRQILETRIVKTAEDLLRQRITQGDSLSKAVESALAGDKSPRQAAEELLKTL
ncbi:methylmalonyl Co-A mutase-associated GTPase MeaB [Rhodospirillales bacterium]|nr:methylmalonyl Co-A mutase-associated GTPase MeaB [Rhodospirillales bacterium]MDB9704165.1 methylmalonyl Co-A mutase-associated GTPase MeaB [Rhodospirillales bacterium]